MTRSGPDWGALQGAIAGDVILPGSPDYESVRKPSIATFHYVRPQAIVLCKAPQDVFETISLARRCGLETATRSGGHCFAGRSCTGDVKACDEPNRGSDARRIASAARQALATQVEGVRSSAPTAVRASIWSFSKI